MGKSSNRFSFKDENSKFTYILDVDDSIILRNIVERLKIKDVTSFNKIPQYLLEIEGREFSATNVIEYLKREKMNFRIYKYKNYLEVRKNS